MHVKKGDKIRVLAGKDKGSTGQIIKVLPEKNRVVVEGVNVYKKHVKPQKQGEQGEVVEVPRPIHASNVAIVCPSCSETVKTGRRSEDGNKVRYCKNCDSPIE